MNVVMSLDLIAHVKIVLIATVLIITPNELAIWFFLDSRLKKLLSFLRPWFLLNVLLIFTLISFVDCFLNHIYISVIIIWIITILLAVTHILKFKILGTPLFFWDYINLKEPFLYINNIIQKKKTWFLIVFITLVILIISYVTFQIQFNSLDLIQRIYLFFVSFFLTLLGFFTFNVEYRKFFPSNSYRDSVVFKTGLFPFLVLTSKYSKSRPEPDNYGQNKIEDIQYAYNINENQKSDKLPENLPNIIIYCIESLMDLEHLGVQLKNHPMPFFDSWADRNGKGFFVSPTIGGQTIQPEFELLTGLSQYQMSVPNPFVHIIDKYKHFPALPSTLKNIGYQTLGIQAVSAHEFLRKKIYPIMDFDRFIALETDYPEEDWEMINNLLSDNYLIRKIKENTKSVEKPIFGLFLTNSTHASYNHWQKNDDFKVLNKNIAVKSIDTLERYASAINHADEALKKLFEYFSEMSRETIIFVFGDHLPGLTNVFNDIKSFNEKNYWNRYQTPLRVMSTFKIEKNYRIISANFLPFLIFDILKLNTSQFPKYFKIIESLYQEFDVFSNYIQDKKGNIYDRQFPPQHLKDICNDYDMIQYDMLEGQRYFNKILH